jgi:hypothetical protein
MRERTQPLLCAALSATRHASVTQHTMIAGLMTTFGYPTIDERLAPEGNDKATRCFGAITFPA